MYTRQTDSVAGSQCQTLHIFMACIMQSCIAHMCVIRWDHTDPCCHTLLLSDWLSCCCWQSSTVTDRWRGNSAGQLSHSNTADSHVLSAHEPYSGPLLGCSLLRLPPFHPAPAQLTVHMYWGQSQAPLQHRLLPPVLHHPLLQLLCPSHFSCPLQHSPRRLEPHAGCYLTNCSCALATTISRMHV